MRHTLSSIEYPECDCSDNNDIVWIIGLNSIDNDNEHNKNSIDTTRSSACTGAYFEWILIWQSIRNYDHLLRIFLDENLCTFEDFALLPVGIIE